MSQREVLDELECCDGWQTADDIHRKVGIINRCSVNESLKRLIKGGFIERKRHPTLKNGYLYRVKKC